MEQLPKFARERLQKAGAGDHPDPDLLAAFAENALPEAERPPVFEHLSRCAGCREVVMLATSADDHAPAEAATRPASELAPAQAASHVWFRRPALRWAALAACIALAIAIVVRHEWNGTRPAETDLAARVARPQPAAQPETKATSRAQNQTTRASAAKPRKPALSASAARPPAKRRAERAKRRAPSPSANVVAAVPKGESAATPLPQPAFAPPVELKEIAPRTAAGEVTGDSAEAQTVTAFAVPKPPSKMDAQRGRSSGAIGGVVAGVAGGVPAPQRVTVATLENAGSAKPPQRTWTLSPEGVLERSDDSGKTWTKIEVGNGSRFRALSAVGPDIWAGGAHGLLFHSTDAGAHWTRVRPVSNGVPLTSTIARIDFTNASQGRLTTGAGETWTTTDAGRTWKRQ